MLSLSLISLCCVWAREGLRGCCTGGEHWAGQMEPENWTQSTSLNREADASKVKIYGYFFFVLSCWNLSIISCNLP